MFPYIHILPKTMFNVILIMAMYDVHLVHCSSTGAPEGAACIDLRPGLYHGTSIASGPANINISLSQNSYKAGDRIQVTLSGGQFKGFLIVARKTNDNTGTTNVGTFMNLTPEAQLACSRTTGNAITHTNSNLKNDVTVNWTAPLDTVGDIIFRYTIVLDSPSNYFVGLNSSVVTAEQPGKFFKDPACGNSKGCYSNCINKQCDLETSWQDKGDHLDISLKSFLSNDSGYVALGFSNQSAMGPANVYLCVLYNNSIEVVTAETNGHRHNQTNQFKDGIKSAVNNFTDGIVQCKFSLQKETKHSNQYNLNHSWYLITARGTVFEGLVRRHGSLDRNATSYRVNLTDTTVNEHFSTIPPTSVAPATTTVAAADVEIGKFTKDGDCGTKKGCYSNCRGDQCDLLSSWARKGDNFEISLKTSTGNAGRLGNENDYYMALGLSTSNKMGEASVMACIVNQGSNVAVYMSRNTANYDNEPLNNPQQGISLVSTSYKDGILQCTFNRVTSMANNSDIYDMTKQWHLITARGKAGPGGTLQQHDGSNRFLTEAQIDFLDTSVDISLEATKYPLIKAHGCLMVITWMFLASVGLGFARFLKPLWPNSMPCGVKVWFAMHRVFMVLALLCGCVGFILIFVEVKDYSEIKGDFYTKAHPILGIITTALLVINPFMSLLRCAPDNPKRPYFNWAHRAVGTIAVILSTIAVTVGLYLPKAQVDTDSGLVIMIVYSAWHLFFLLIMSLLNDLTTNVLEITFKNPSKKGNTYALKNIDHNGVYQNSSADVPKPAPPNSGLKKFFMLLHICVLCALTIALLYYIIEGNV